MTEPQKAFDLKKAGLDKRRFLARALTGAGTLLLGGCYDLSQKPWFTDILGRVENLTKNAQHLFAGPQTLAPEFTKSDISPVFRANGTLDPGTTEYAAHAAKNFADWRITVGGLVNHPLSLSMAQLRSLPARTQITRHDCVEGWSCIGEWTGPQLKILLAAAGPKPAARYAIFYCADPMTAEGDPDHKYYESLDMVEAMHPQTILAYRLNGADLGISHGAPVRLRAERQLGYKQPKYIQHIELVEDFGHIQGGKGGYWEDLGYSWYGGI
jgi:DMSO/TMAO reductase YedYZ molybdopterin-dependent catalytic subunit